MLPVSRLLDGSVRPADALRHGLSTATLPPELIHFAADKKPVVVWNATRRCNLYCMHCYSDSQNREYPGELTTEEGLRIIDDVARFGAPTMIFSGGEPLMRPDLFQLAAHASRCGLRCVLSTNGTLISEAVAERIRDAGFVYVGISLDGLRQVHDKVRGSRGAFDEALAGIRRCRDQGVKVGVRLTLHRKNADQLPGVLDLLEAEDIPRFCMYHLAYAGRGDRIRKFDLDPAETRAAVDYLFQRVKDFHRRGLDKEILTVDNHADSAYLYLRVREEEPERAEEVRRLLAWNGGNQSGIGISSVDPLGSVHADQFSWHYSFGNVRERPFSCIWPDTSHPRMAILKDRQAHLKGRCRGCRFLDLCNGNLRARAESYFDDFLAPDPACYLADEEIGLTAGSPEARAAQEWPVPVQAAAREATS
jgi:radical SAM protein with 4Fe4S-binding SPASM domain